MVALAGRCWSWGASEVALWPAAGHGAGMQTGRISMFGGGRSRGWSYTAGGEWFTTDGYIAVAEEQDPGIVEAMNGVALAWFERYERSRFAGHRLGGGRDRDPAGDHFDDCAFADAMIGEGFALQEVEDHDSAFRR